MSHRPRALSLTRRKLLASAAAAGAFATLGSLPAKAATPTRGGHARYAVRAGSTSDTLDPATFSHVFMRTAGYGFCNTLAEIDGNNRLQPELVESWEAEPGAKTWVFRVRPEVTFHNGKTLGAEDVIASIQHHRGEDSISGVKSLLKPITEIRAEDARTIRFELARGNADFPYIFADYRMMIMPAKDGKMDWQQGVGTGGYVLKEFDPGVRATLERNPNYWRGDRAFFDSAEVIAMPDVAARQNALISGSIDIVDQVDLKTVSMLKRAEGVEVADTAGGLHYTYLMNSSAAPFDNNQLRLALKYGIDREALLQKVLRGYGTIGNDHPIGPSTPFYAADVEQRPFDPERAKHHLKMAGYETIALKLSVSDVLYPGAVDGAVLYQEQLVPTGIELEVVREPADGYFSNVWMKKPFVASYWSARPTADIMFSTAYGSEAPWNDTRWHNERFDSLLAAARSELDEDKRAQMYREMQLLVRDDGGAVIPLFANNVFALSTAVAHPDAMAGNWELDGGRSIERWWMRE